MPKRDYLHLVALAKTIYLLIYVALAQWSIICCGAYLNIVLLIYVALAQSIFYYYYYYLWGTGPNNGLPSYVALAPKMINFCTVMSGCSFCSFRVYVLFLSFQVTLSSKSWEGFRSYVEVQGGCNY